MNWSEITLKTLRENPVDAEMESHRLLTRAGYIKKVAPGIFTYSFLFLRSLRKIEDILRDELNKVGCHEILMPMVQPAELWKESGRWPKMTELLKFKNKNNQDFCLGATHEEVVVDFIRKDIKSYRDLPFLVYQIQTKYRDEIRPRYGLMRCREFNMKDAYSFNKDKKGALDSYQKMKKTYESIFKRLGVEFVSVQADSGAIGGELSSEFQVLADHGMDQILLCQNCNYGTNLEMVSSPVQVSDKPSNGETKPLSEAAMENIPTGDISQAEQESPCPECGKPLTLKRGIEVGHIFYLGTQYSEPMGLKYLDETGKTQTVEMGCYGIGVTRSLQAVVEQSHDNQGICWPRSLSPFDIHICLLDPEDKELTSWLGDFQKNLLKKGLSFFVDDRQERPGIKFKDADLLGFPLRVTVGKKGFENKEVEFFIRKSKEKIKVPLDQVFSKTPEILERIF